MKILLVSASSFYFPGGIKEHVDGLYNYLKFRGHYVKIVAPRYKRDEEYGDDIILMGRAISVCVNASMTELSFMEKKSEISNVLKDVYDIIHFHNPGVFLSQHILKESKSKNIVTAHFLADASVLYKLSVLSKFSGRILENWFGRKVFEKIDGMIAISKPVLDYIPKEIKCPKTVIPEAIDLTKFSPETDRIRKFNDGKLNILFLGRIEKRKGLEYLIKAYEKIAQKYSNIRLIVVGSGKDENKCKMMAKKMKLTNIEFVGSVFNDEKPKFFATADIFCSPAIYGESFGIVLLEAMASGKPLVAFSNRGYKTVLTGKGKSFLVEPKDIDGLAKSIELLIQNEGIRKEMSKWGLEEVKKYSWGIVGRQIEDFYEKILKNDRSV